MKIITINLENEVVTVESSDTVTKKEFAAILKALIKKYGNQLPE